MPAKYKLVLRKDMRKDAAEGSKLYYASANTTGTCDVYELCDLISAQSTASSGDVKLILDELVNVMRRNLGKGEVVKVGELGSFQLQFGSTGTLTEKEFSHALIKKPPHRLPPRQAAERCDQELHVREDRFRCSGRGQRRGRR